MEKVWIDFPRQRLSKSKDGKPNLLLNYLGFAKRPKYREFFCESNSKLRLRTIKTVFR
jgi:hypothetical protein